MKMHINRKRKSTKLEGYSQQVKASSVYMVCNIIQRGLAFFTIPIFSRIMTQEEMGVSTVYSSTMALLIIFTSLQLPYGSLNKAMVKYENDRDGYISSCNGIFTLLTLCYFAVYFCFKERINSLMNMPTVLMVFMGLEMLFSSSVACWMGKNRFELKYKKIAVLTIIQTVLISGISLIAVIMTKQYKGEVKVIASCCISVVFGFVIYICSVIKGKKFFNAEYWKYAFSFNIPLLIYYFSQMVFNQSDRLMIDNICGRADAARYGLAYTVGLILTIVLNAVNNSYVPWFYEKIGENEFGDNRKVTYAFSVFFAVLLLGVIAVGPEMILFLGGSGYMSAMWVVPPVAFSMLFLFYAQIFINVEFYYEEKGLLVVGSILSALFNILLNYYYIRVYGYIAAAYTTLASFILFAVCNYFCMVYTCKKRGKKSDVVDIKRLIAVAILFAVCMAILMLLYNHIVIRYCLIGLALIMIFAFRKKLVAEIKKYLALYR